MNVAENWSMSFDVDGESTARALATALSQHGFTQVDGYPNADGSWSVSASSYGPHRNIWAGGAMERAAVAIARPFRGRPGMICSSGMAPHARLEDYPIMLDRPGVQPPVPVNEPIATPPAAQLAWVPDLVVSRLPDLSGLDRVEWAKIDAVFGDAERIPTNVRLLASLGPDDDWQTVLEEDVFELLANSGDLWESAAVTIPYLAEIARCTGNPVLRRDLVGCLVWFGCNRATDLIIDADIAAIEDRAPTASVPAEQAHAAVGAEAAGLLATWPDQPPAVRFQLALLAALYPEHGRALRIDVEALAESVPGTSHQVILHLALAMIDGRYDEAIVIAEPTGRWERGFLDDAWLDAPGITDRISAEHAIGRNPCV